MSQALAILAMKRSDWVRERPAAVAALAAFVLSAATLVGAYFFQFVLKLVPCPLCLEQRIPYYVIIPMSLLLTIAAIAGVPRKLLGAGFVVIAIAALCGAALGVYHAGVEWHFWAGPTDCTGQLGDLRAGGPLLEQLRSFNVVRCDEAAWRFLGLSLAGYNVLISLALAVLAGCGLRAPRHAG